MSEDLLFHMADKACLRASRDNSWDAIHKHLLKLCMKTENNGWKRKTGMTQTDKILNHMRKNGSITQREAYIDYGVQSFHPRLTEIKDAGYKIIKSSKRHPTTGQSYSRYFLDEQLNGTS